MKTDKKAKKKKEEGQNQIVNNTNSQTTGRQGLPGTENGLLNDPVLNSTTNNLDKLPESAVEQDSSKKVESSEVRMHILNFWGQNFLR